MNVFDAQHTHPERIVSLIYSVTEAKRKALFNFLARAIPFYERPGNIQVTLYESLDQEGTFLEMVAYADADSYEEDQKRVDSSEEFKAVLGEWHQLIAGKPQVMRLKKIDLPRPAYTASKPTTSSVEVLIERAAFSDHAAISNLLEEAGLPIPNETDKPVHFIVARQQGRVVACLGWEPFGYRALLRSLVVHRNLQRQGIGIKLVQEAIEILVRNGISEFYLLTESAADFASRLGFQAIDRCALPAEIQSCQQFSSGCCAGAQCMQLKLPSSIS